MRKSRIYPCSIGVIFVCMFFLFVPASTTAEQIGGRTSGTKSSSESKPGEEYQEVQREQRKLPVNPEEEAKAYEGGQLAGYDPATALTKDEVFRCFKLTKSDIMRQYGSDYIIIRTGVEGLMRGYFYRRLGVCFTFHDNGTLLFVDCSRGFEIDGARAGMSLDQIQSILGDSSIKVVYLEGEIKVHILEYAQGDLFCIFQSRQYKHDDRTSLLRVIRKL
jgi:hypothetical protein